jgi:hypothetical protein
MTEFTDLPENRLVRVYSLEQIATEKTLALADRARNEPRDLYDLWHLTSSEGIEIGPQADAMRQKLRFRGKPFEGCGCDPPKRSTAESALVSTSCLSDDHAAGVR